jgi:UDP-N-acetylglucosamine 2-epimerase (non-hydrolysing)
MKIVNVVGARPNFMKISPIIRAIDSHNKRIQSSRGKNNSIFDSMLVHTGQHYDYKMSRVFFDELEIPKPDIHLGIGSGSHAEQTGNVMIAFEKILLKTKPDLVLVVGDVNSTFSCALAAAKLHIPVAHVEAGLRSFDRLMPEEINRVLTDAISDFLFTPSVDADENLLNEGISSEKIFRVGDVMVDSLLFNLDKAKASTILKDLGLENGLESNYSILTLHRPSNVDNYESLSKIIEALKEISKAIPILFPIHPRTRKQLELCEFYKYFKTVKNEDFKLPSTKSGLYCIEPLGYLDFLKLMQHAKLIMTDSGGIQEETTVLGQPCLTLRDTTERPITLSQGTNILVHNDTERIICEAFRILGRKRHKKCECPKLWDGKTAERIVDIIAKGL